MPLALLKYGFSRNYPAERHFPARPELKPRYDVVIIDSPAVPPVDDAATLGQHAGTALIVARHRVTTVARLAEATKRLTQAGVLLKGVVLNGLQPNGRMHGYQYKSHYELPRASTPAQALAATRPPEGNE